MNERVLCQILRLTAALPRFSEHYAIDGLSMAEVFVPHDVVPTDDQLLAMALVVTWWGWIDDRLDDEHSEVSLAGLDQLIGYASDPAGSPRSNRPELQFFSRLETLLAERTGTRIDHDWWSSTAAAVLRGMRAELVLASGSVAPTYSECLENGSRSVTMLNILASTSSVYGMKRAARQNDIGLCDLERGFCLQQRLLNDLHSYDKEARQNCSGCHTNLVLQMNQTLPLAEAKCFIEQQLLGYERLLRVQMEVLGATDRFVLLLRRAMAGIAEWYGGEQPRLRPTHGVAAI